MSAVGPWMVPQWPAPAPVRAVFTLRGRSAADGASRGAHAWFNLGAHVGDAPDAVRANRDRLARRLGVQPVFLQQVHGSAVACLDATAAPAPAADAALTTEAGRACTIMVADCLPVLLCDDRGRAVAAVHAGWRGLAAGVLENTVRALQQRLGGQARLLAWLGPCIGPDAFEVGAEVRRAFVSVRADHAGAFRPLGGGKFMADLAGLARQRLRAAGVDAIHGNNSSRPWCSVHGRDRFFSHRRDHREQGASGRMAACIWLG